MTIEHLKDILKKSGIKPTEKFGQNFMLDETILVDMVEASGLRNTELAIEIGPGIGNLTKELLLHAKRVVSIEKDERMKDLLRRLEKHNTNFSFKLGDALHINYEDVIQAGEEYRVVANIPYYITGKLMQLFLRLTPKPRSITVLVQKEVAQNIVAKPGNLSLLGISVQIMGHPRLVAHVPAFKFYPQPKVDSAVVHIEVPQAPPYIIGNEKEFFKVLKACFMGKRKQVHNTLRSNVGLSAVQTEMVLAVAGILPASRPQHISIPQWIRLVDEISRLQKQEA